MPHFRELRNHCVTFRVRILRALVSGNESRIMRFVRHLFGFLSRHVNTSATDPNIRSPCALVEKQTPLVRTKWHIELTPMCEIHTHHEIVIIVFPKPCLLFRRKFLCVGMSVHISLSFLFSFFPSVFLFSTCWFAQDDTMRWYTYSLRCYTEMLHWDGTLRWHIEMTHWDDSLRWLTEMTHRGNSLKWHTEMTHCDDTLRWH